MSNSFIDGFVDPFKSLFGLYSPKEKKEIIHNGRVAQKRTDAKKKKAKEVAAVTTGTAVTVGDYAGYLPYFAIALFFILLVKK